VTTLAMTTDPATTEDLPFPADPLEEFAALTAEYANARLCVIETAEAYTSAVERAADLRERYVTLHGALVKSVPLPERPESPLTTAAEDQKAYERAMENYQAELDAALLVRHELTGIRIEPLVIPGGSNVAGLRERLRSAATRRV